MKELLRLVSTSLLIMLLTIMCSLKATAAVDIQGKQYEFDKDAVIEFNKAKTIQETSKMVSLGYVSLIGNLTEAGKVGTVLKVDVLSKDDGTHAGLKGDAVRFCYRFDSKIYNRANDQWKLSSCDDKVVDGINLGKRIESGAIIVQSSMDGKKWITESIMADSFNAEKVFPVQIYQITSTNNIQIANGCYYRVIVSYLERKMTKHNVFFADEYDYSKAAEVYEFFLFSSEKKADMTRLENATNKMGLGKLVKTETDNGYYGDEVISLKDPHYGWQLGSFYVCGYSDINENNNDAPVFLKNAGDKVTLWFRLDQNIERLNENPNLSINYDEKIYDRYFQTLVQDFKHGALIIKYTNTQNESRDPIIYTDYLAACAINGEDKAVELFEEGDYEVALDYEIKKDGVIPQYTNYRVYFKFSIRNGNAMVFPFDTETGEELGNNSYTPNGFVINYANSKSIKVYVEHKQIVNGNEDTRGNKPAKDGNRYTTEGIYIITVKNENTNQETKKTIFVGSSPIYKAIANNEEFSAREISNMLKDGYEIDSTGKLIKPNTTESIEPKEDSSDDSGWDKAVNFFKNLVGKKEK